LSVDFNAKYAHRKKLENNFQKSVSEHVGVINFSDLDCRFIPWQHGQPPWCGSGA